MTLLTWDPEVATASEKFIERKLFWFFQEERAGGWRRGQLTSNTLAPLLGAPWRELTSNTLALAKLSNLSLGSLDSIHSASSGWILFTVLAWSELNCVGKLWNCEILLVDSSESTWPWQNIFSVCSQEYMWNSNVVSIHLCPSFVPNVINLEIIHASKCRLPK